MATREEALAVAETQLAEVRAAISRVLHGGQSRTVNDRQRVETELRDLRAYERDLKAEIARLSGGSSGLRFFKVVPQ